MATGWQRLAFGVPAGARGRLRYHTLHAWLLPLRRGGCRVSFTDKGRELRTVIAEPTRLPLPVPASHCLGHRMKRAPGHKQGGEFPHSYF